VAGGPPRPHRSGHPPLYLYIHVPWCQRKCPYCDFNSRPRPALLPESAYREALLQDLAQELGGLAEPRPLTSIFIGGGTPSLLSGETIDGLLRGIRALSDWPRTSRSRWRPTRGPSMRRASPPTARRA
jgi:coproporphyrinogen III oxidase-like Fe-S oxidoreductase